jgi:hypothetical protein
MIGTWKARQSKNVTPRGTVWDGSDPKSAVDVSLAWSTNGTQPDNPQSQYQYHSADILAYTDDPGIDLGTLAKMLGRPFYPYDLTMHYSFRSWLELGGREMCSTTWTLDIVYENGQRKACQTSP